MGRKKLIFLVAEDPAINPALLMAAYDWAKAVAVAEVATEVRLAGHAVLMADPAYIATLTRCRELRERIDGTAGGSIEVSVCPESVDAHGIHEDQLVAIGARSRPLAEILIEVADGRSMLIRI